MEYEELTLGQPENDEPPGLHPLTWVALAIGCLLAGVVLMLRNGPAEPAAAELPTSTPSGTPTGPFAGRLGGKGVNLTTVEPQSLGLGRICPAVTDGRRSLIVSFTLVNIGSRDVTVIDVKPELPIGGLRPLGPNQAGGTCEHPEKQAPGGLLTPGATQLVTMRFRLPSRCPQPYPVQARVKLRVNEMVGTTTVGVYSDLGAIDFDTCPDSP